MAEFPIAGLATSRKSYRSSFPHLPLTSVQPSLCDSVLATLRSNWLNGMALSDQKSVAKALIKLNLNAYAAGRMATATGVDDKTLASIATKLSTGQALTPEETDAYGRFDLLLSAVLDQGYQRGDQRYRNSSKLLAVPVAVGLAVLGAWAISPGPLSTTRHLEGHNRWNPRHPAGPSGKGCRERDSTRLQISAGLEEVTYFIDLRADSAGGNPAAEVSGVVGSCGHAARSQSFSPARRRTGTSGSGPRRSPRHARLSREPQGRYRQPCLLE